MESVEIKDEEKANLTQEGYKGEMAKKMESKGYGIGMYIIDQLLKINNGRIVINCNLDKKRKFDRAIPYCKNEFIILLPKLAFKPR
jgi:signal transduction histidine kinase